MTKYILLYNGPASDPSNMSEEEQNAIMAKWGEWMQRVGGAMVDMGSPMGPSTAVVDDGSTAATAQVNGYTIIEADDMDAAKALVEGHPFLSDSEGKFNVGIHELQPIPEM